MHLLRSINLVPLALLAAACSTTSGSLPPQPSYSTPFAAQWQDDESQPRGGFDVRLGAGKLTFEFGSGEHETDARHFSAGFERVGGFVGGGFRIGATVSDDDLLGGPDDSAAVVFDLFGHVTLRPSVNRFRIPIRLGPDVMVHGLAYETNLGDDDHITWVSYGLRLEVEPEIDLVRDDSKSMLSLYGKLKLGGGIAMASVDTEFEDDDYDTRSFTRGGEIGLRFNPGRFLLEAGYMVVTTTYAETDSSDNWNTRLPETDFGFSGPFIAFGMRW